MAVYLPPELQKDAFNCPHCGIVSHQVWEHGGNVSFYDDDLYHRNCVGTPIPDLLFAFCSHCIKFSIWHESEMVYPLQGGVEPPNEDMPEDCQADYREAADILSLSPRGAAALLRLCLQKLMKYLGEKGENINEDIKALVKKGLDPKIQKAADICRVTGNHAVHPGMMDLQADPQLVYRLFRLLNIIVDHRITQPKEMDEMFRGLPENTVNAIEKRDKN